VTRFLLKYSTTPDDKRFPRQGEVVEIETLADLRALQARTGGRQLVLPTEKYGPDHSQPFWADDIIRGFWDEDDRESYHTVSQLPEDWKTLHWLEVYNGYRE
jgi:hypothetical protein